eukprot:Gb_36518 [translate_table: standard]
MRARLEGVESVKQQEPMLNRNTSMEYDWSAMRKQVDLLLGSENPESSTLPGYLLGCGHGLPAIFACLKGAATVHFQDFNAEVLRCLTIPNVNVNLGQACEQQCCQSDGEVTLTSLTTLAPDVHFYAGDWGELHTLLSVVSTSPTDSAGEVNPSCIEDDVLLDGCSTHDGNADNQETHLDCSSDQQVRRTRKLSQSRACEWASDNDQSEGGYDIILMAETVYSPASMQKLNGLIKKCLRRPYGVVYLAAKKHYFGVGGGTRQFRSLIEDEGNCESLSR